MNIKELSEIMSVSEADLKCLAQSVVNSISKDGLAEQFLSMKNEDQAEVAKAYVVDANKKMQSFHTTYLTNPNARESFQHSVLALV